MTYQMRLATEYFEKIKNATKTIECRLYDNKRKELKVGDTIEFNDTKNKQHKIITEIIALYPFPSFSDLLNHFPIASFGSEKKEQLLSALKQFYSDDDEKKYGVVGIEIKLKYISPERERLLELENADKYVFHGTAERLESLDPRQAHNFVEGKNVKDGAPAVFASSKADYAIMMAIINKKNCPRGCYSRAITSGTSKEDAIVVLSATKKTLEQLGEDVSGYVYVFERNKFMPRNVTQTEYRSETPVIPVEIINVNKKDLPENIATLEE